MPHRHVRCLALVLGLSLSACDCGTPPDVPGDLTVTVSPVDGATGVSVLGPFTLTLNQEPTGAVADATATMTWDRGFNEQPRRGTRIAGTLSASGKVVSFTPAQPLEAGITYRLTISGLNTAAGAVPEQNVRFRTWDNPATGSTTRSAADTITQVVVTTYAADGSYETAIFGAAGADGQWNTADDVQTYLSLFFQAVQGHWTRHSNTDNPGTDTEWGTADDFLRYTQLRTFDAQGGLIYYDHFADLGPDSEPFTGDEPISFRRHTLFRADGLPERHTYLSGPGLDGEWLTADDAATSYSTYEYDSNGRRTRSVGHNRGPDDLLYTADDEVAGYTEYIFDANDRLSSSADVTEAGADGTWFTADDGGRWPYAFEYDARGLLTRQSWFDDSNQLGGCEDYTYDDDGRMLTMRRYGAGPDGVLLTADDFVELEYRYSEP